jgi:serine/threonine protein kinase
MSSAKLDVFDLGLLLFVAALGGIDVLDSKELERVANRPLTACCVLHCGNEVVSQSGHVTIPQYFTTKHYSPEFLDFLCKCLKFSEVDRLSIEQLQKHPWITSKTTKGPHVSLKELIQIERQWRQTGSSAEQQGTAEGQLERLCESMASVLPCCENYESIISKFIKGQIEKDAIKELALDTGLDIEIVWDKLMRTIKKIQGSKI